MPTQQEIDQQWELLRIHRDNLANLLVQQARHGGSAYAPPRAYQQHRRSPRLYCPSEEGAARVGRVR
jgi:hypothetical protein